MIEWSQIDELEAEMGESFPEVVALFLEEAGAIVARLERTDPNDAPAMASDLHALKGAALNLGMHDFAELCARGEKHAEAGETGAIGLPSLTACFRESCSALESRLARGVA